MCGINGYIKYNRSGMRDVVRSMNNAIAYRGPDSSGVWSEEGCTLGHLRLSIIDLSERSSQPFVKGGLVIVFNGEIYNYRELKSSLNDVSFITESDTEVVLELWRRYGAKSLNMLRGMFAFAIHDCDTKDTFVVRDHFGIKPLYYVERADGFVFSSELKAIEQACPSDLQVSNSALAASMLYVWIPEENCIWDNVNKLAPGTYLRISAKGKVEKSSYWSTRSLLDKSSQVNSESSATELLGKVLEESVSAHLVSDVPVNAFLSGGLDSSLLVAMARRHLDSLDCYTIKFSERDQKHEVMADDAYYARKVARHLGVRLHTIEVNPDLADLLPKIVGHLGEPIGDSAAINTFLICDAAHRAGVKVLLSGMGADEIFAGYRKHLANKLAAKYRIIPSRIRALVEWPIMAMPVASSEQGNRIARWAKRFFSFSGLPEADAFFRSYTYYDLESLGAAFESDISSGLMEIQRNHHESFDYARERRDLVDAMCFTDINKFMVSLNLNYSDRASMAASTEVRVPFIDIEVMKAAFSIDSGLKLKGRNQKYILKKVAERWLPHEIIYRPKSSFTMPLRAWIKNDLQGLVSDYLLSDEGLSGRKILKPTFIKELIEDEVSGREDNAQKIWHLLTLEQWFRNRRLVSV